MHQHSLFIRHLRDRNSAQKIYTFNNCIKVHCYIIGNVHIQVFI